jgi:hypothetical protein
VRRKYLRRPRTRGDLEREIWQTAHGDLAAFLERQEAVLRPMIARMIAELDPRPDDLDRFIGLTLFFEAAALVRTITAQDLSEMLDDEIRRLALCLGLEPNWSTKANHDGNRSGVKLEE